MNPSMLNEIDFKEIDSDEEYDDFGNLIVKETPEATQVESTDIRFIDIFDNTYRCKPSVS